MYSSQRVDEQGVASQLWLPTNFYTPQSTKSEESGKVSEAVSPIGTVQLSLFPFPMLLRFHSCKTRPFSKAIQAKHNTSTPHRILALCPSHSFSSFNRSINQSAPSINPSISRAAPQPPCTDTPSHLYAPRNQSQPFYPLTSQSPAFQKKKKKKKKKKKGNKHKLFRRFNLPRKTQTPTPALTIAAKITRQPNPN